MCLLSTLAKAVETIVNRRLQEELEKKKLLSDRQYGFRQGRSTLMAIECLMKSVEADHGRFGVRREMVLLILLDVKDALNSVEWRAILEALQDKGIPAYLRRLVSSYLQTRSVKEGNAGYPMSAGVPQGSVLGPTLWNIAYNGVLELAVLVGVELYAYADDLAVLMKAKEMDDLERLANHALEEISTWVGEHSLRLAPEETGAVWRIQKRDARVPNILVEKHEVQIGGSAKYLGVHLEPGSCGMAHIKSVTAKATKAAMDISRILPRTYGATENQRRLLAAVAESICLYAAPVWARRAMKN